MDIEEVDYSKDPQLDRVTFGHPCFSSSESGPNLPSDPFLLNSSLVVTMLEHCSAPPLIGSLSIKSPMLDAPLLSPRTLHILTMSTLPSPSFDPYTPFSTFFAATSAGIHTSVAPNPYFPIHLSSDCFETLALKIKFAKTIPLEGSPDPLADHPSDPRSGKIKSKCMKTTSMDIMNWFGETSAIGEAVIMANTILVRHVHRRAYSATRITLWVEEN